MVLSSLVIMRPTNEAVQPHHEENIEAYDKDSKKGGQVSCNDKHKVNAVKRGNTKLNSFSAQISTAKAKIASLAKDARHSNNKNENKSFDNTVNDFGGKVSTAKKRVLNGVDVLFMA